MASFQMITTALNGAKSAYESSWALPLGMAYSCAYDGFSETLKEQQDMERAQTEIFFTLVTLGAMSGMGALFAKRASKLATSGAIPNATVSIAVQGTAKKPAEYFFSKMSSGVEAIVKSQTIKAMQKLADSTTDLTGYLEKPLIYRDKMMMANAEAHKLASDALLDIVSSETLSDAEKEAMYDDMLAAPYIRNAPKSKIFEDYKSAGAAIELSWYMLEVMASDHFQIVDVNNSTGDVMPGGGVRSRNPISVRTTSSKYPKAYHNVKTTRNIFGIPTSNKGEYGQIVYNGVGSKIRDRINLLHGNYPGKKGKKFFSGKMDQTEIKNAEKLYDDVVCSYNLPTS